MDAFELLKADHQKVADLFKQIESGSEQNKTQLFAQLKNELDVHAHIEEVIFYPALENKEESRDITLEAYEEHKVVKDLLAQLDGDSPDEEWDAKLTVLKENVEHHVDEEEGELFSKARKVLSDDQIENLGNEMEAEKARQQGTASPAKRRATGEGANRKRTQPGRAAKAKDKEKPGVLKRLANLVGLGGDSSPADKRSRKGAKAAKGKTSSKKTKGGAGKTSGKAANSSKSAKASKSSKRSGSKKSAGKTPNASSKRSGSKKSGSAPRGAKKAGGSVKKAGRRR